MAIKNYTTRIASEKTILEIEALLIRKGARQIMKEYGPTAQVCKLCFMLSVKGQDLPFALPLRTESVLKILKQEKRNGELRKFPNRDIDEVHASRVGWRILKDWIDAQLALVEIGMADMEEIFMPYLYNPRSRQTLYEISKAGGFRNLLPAVTG